MLFRSGRCEELFPLLAGVTVQEFMAECEEFVLGAATFKSEWLQEVAYPIKMAYLCKNKPQERWDWINRILATDWHIACHDWASRLADRKKLN